MNPADILSQLFGSNVASATDWLWAMEEHARTRYFARQRTGDAPRSQASFAATVTADGVAVIPIHGVMVRRAEYDDEVSTVAVTNAVRAATANPAVRAILLDMDSPGGSVAGLEELGEALDQASAVKPTATQVSQMCCSAAYETACHTGAIYARRDHVIGSIGTRLHVFDWSQMFANLGVKSIPIDTGEFKSTGAFGTELTANQQAYLKDLVQAFQQHFSATVMRARGMSQEELAAVATGRVWTAEQALGLKLIDGVQKPEQTLALLAEKAPALTQRTPKMSQEENTPEAPKAVTIQQLKKAFPEAKADWLLEQVEEGVTMEAASLSYANAQAKRADEAEAKLKAAEEAQAKAAADAAAEAAANANTPTRGVKPVGGSGEAGAKTVDYYGEAEALVRDKKLTASAAMHRVVRKYGQPAAEAFVIGKMSVND